MFKVGTNVVYGKSGVCRVEAVGTGKELGMSVTPGSRELLYYKLAPLFSSGTIYAPVDGSVRIRKALDSQEALECLERVSSIIPEVFRSSQVSRLKEHYQSLTETCDLLDYFAIIKEGYIKQSEAVRQHKRLGQVDERYLRLAEGLVFGEFSVALHSTPEQIKSRLETVLGIPSAPVPIFG